MIKQVVSCAILDLYQNILVLSMTNTVQMNTDTPTSFSTPRPDQGTMQIFQLSQITSELVGAPHTRAHTHTHTHTQTSLLSRPGPNPGGSECAARLCHGGLKKEENRAFFRSSPACSLH